MNARERQELVGQLAARGWLRLVQQVLDESTAAFWNRRAEEFADVGTRAAAGTALACRRHAALLAELDLGASTVELLREYYEAGAA